MAVATGVPPAAALGVRPQGKNVALSKLDLHYLDKLQREIHQHLDFLQYIVTKYGKVKAVGTKDYDREVHLHDFIFFCITKATRSTEAADVLLTQGFSEDAMTVTRGIYECFLHLAFIQRNEYRIDDFLSYKIFAYARPDSHPKTKKGKPIYDKIIDPETKEHRALGVSLIHLSQDTGVSIDEKLHSGFYSLLSEFSHVHIIAGASYWSSDGKSYDHNTRDYNIYQAVIWCLYSTWLVVQSTSTLKQISLEDRKAAEETCSDSAELLVETIEEMSFDEGIQHLKPLFLERLQYGE